MDFSARTRSLQRTVVLFALIAAGVAISTSTMSTFELPKAVLVTAAGAITAVVGAARTAVTGELRLRHPILLGAVAIFLLLSVAAAIFSDSPMLSIAGEYERQTGLVIYLAYGTLLVATMSAFDLERIQQVAVALLGAAGVAAVYGLLQAVDLDPLNFAGQYADQIFSTLGNPNWAASYIALGVPVAAGIVLSRRWPIWARLGAGAVGLLALGVSTATGSLQGPLVAAAGLGLVTVAWCLGRGGIWRARVAPAVTAVGGLGAAVLALGILSVGPLAAVGAQDSVRLRKLYWQSAWEMFLDHPLTGVGFDLFGSYFVAYRPDAALQYDARLGVTAPHSVPLGWFASGGFLLGMAYLAVVVVTGWLLVGGLLRHDGERLLLLAGLGGAWVGYQAQSLISIDVPSLAATHWILAGAVAVVAGDDAPQTLRSPWASHEPAGGRRRRITWLVTAGAAAAVLLVAASVWSADVLARDSARLRRSGDAAAALDRGHLATSRAPWHPEYWLTFGQALHAAGELDDALAAFGRAADLDPRDAAPHAAAAAVHDQGGELDAAWRRYETAMDLSRDNPVVLAQAGQFLRRQGAVDPALALFTHAVEKDPGDARFHLFRGEALADLGREAEARSSLLTALELATDGSPQPADDQVAQAARETLAELDGES